MTVYEDLCGRCARMLRGEGRQRGRIEALLEAFIGDLELAFGVPTGGLVRPMPGATAEPLADWLTEGGDGRWWTQLGLELRPAGFEPVLVGFSVSFALHAEQIEVGIGGPGESPEPRYVIEQPDAPDFSLVHLELIPLLERLIEAGSPPSAQDDGAGGAQLTP